MPSLPVRNLENESVGTLELRDDVFAAPVNASLLWEAVRHYTAGLRRGTHKTKGRGEVAGSGRKLWKQKGTGRARIGSVRSPIWRHGGTVHGPQPRSYSWTMPRKKLQAALRSALAARYQDGALIVVDAFALEEAKTRRLRQALDKLEAGKSALLVEAQTAAEPLERSARNLAGVELLAAPAVHPWHLLRYPRIVCTRAALERLQAAAQPATKRPGAVA